MQKLCTGGRFISVAGKPSENESCFAFATYDSDEFYDGVMVTAVSKAKGLEFDQVVIPDADDWNYNSEYDRGLLYVACTRAMHRLTLIHGGKVSRFVPEESFK